MILIRNIKESDLYERFNIFRVLTDAGFVVKHLNDGSLDVYVVS